MSKHYMHARAASNPFTLIELLVVISVIALLASLTFPVFARSIQRAKHVRWQGFAGSMRADTDMVGQFTLEDTETIAYEGTDKDAILNTALGAKRPTDLNGQMIGCAKSQYGRWHGKGTLYFAGSDKSYLTINDGEEFKPKDGSMTLVTWFKPTERKRRSYIISKGSYTPRLPGWSVYVNGYRIRFSTTGYRVYKDGRGRERRRLVRFNSRVRQRYEANTWYMAAMVMSYDNNRTTITTYLNGEVITTRQYTGIIEPFTARNNTTYVARSVRRGWSFKGYVDEITFFKRALTENEIQDAYKMGQP